MQKAVFAIFLELFGAVPFKIRAKLHIPPFGPVHHSFHAPVEFDSLDIAWNWITELQAHKSNV